jgi:peptide/nickel transport system substrate-binding protein
VTHWTPRTAPSPLLGVGLATTLFAVGLPSLGYGQAPSSQNSIVIVTGQEAPMPIPTLMEGAQANVANFEIADQLFLRLAGLGADLTTAGDRGFVPLLARRWTRRDSVTLAFELDPRARWHDGTPVTAKDVVFTFERARDVQIAPRTANLLRHIVAITAENDDQVIFRFSHPYAEQLYDATFHVAILPAHLLRSVPAAELSRSEFARHPIGSGPYRWVRSVPGQFIELAANDEFFLGRPRIRRVIVRVASDPEARMNLLLGGEADAMDNIPPPLSNIRRIAARPDLRLVPVPSPALGYLLFNQRQPGDNNRPHPILADRDIRRAITLALDRGLLIRVVFGNYAEVPFGPTSPLLWIRHGAPAPLTQNQTQARHLLAAHGWSDHDGDGVLDREGQPLSLRLNFPNTSAIRRQMSLLIQEQLRSMGIRIELQELEAPVWVERRRAGNFDIDFSATSLDPSPSGLTQSWSCAGGNNVAHYCDPVVDSLLERAILGRGEPREAWHAVLRRIEEDAPAAFLYAPTYVYAVNRRFRDVVIRPESSWLDLWRWSVSRPAGSRETGY